MRKQAIATAPKSAVIKAAATQLNEATESGQHRKRSLIREIWNNVDRHVHVGPARLGLAAIFVILAVFAISGTAGFISAAAARYWPLAALLVVLMILGVFLDKVRQTQRRDVAFKAGLCVAAKDREVPAVAKPAQDRTKA